MKGASVILGLLMVLIITMDCSCAVKKPLTKDTVYTVRQLKKPFPIDGNWEKSGWARANTIEIKNYMGKVPAFQPTARVKMLYDNENLYVIFQVQDRYVRSLVQENNGRVSTDACVEWFFSPDTSKANHYFNLETNAGGTPLMAYHIFGRKEFERFTDEELSRIEIAHSLPRKVDPEITERVTWTLEYKLPVSLLQQHASVALPKPGVVWRANFYKTAGRTSNPHWITWALVKKEIPDFHLPEFFGQIKFQ